VSESAYAIAAIVRAGDIVVDVVVIGGTSAAEGRDGAWNLARDRSVPVSRTHMARKESTGDLRRPVIASSAAVVACFLLATAFAEYRTRLGGNPAVDLASTISPRIEELASAVVRLHDLEIGVAASAHGCSDQGCGPDGRLAALGRQVGDVVRAYVSNPTARLTAVERAALAASGIDLERSVAELGRALVTRDRTAAERLAFGRFAEVVDREEHELDRAIQSEAHFALLEVERLSDARRARMLLVVILDAVSVIMAVILTRQALRAVVGQQRLERAKAEELESFAGRVAHDVLNPVTAAELVATNALRRAGGCVVHAEALERVVRNLRRARELVDALLEFARAGAQPRAGQAVKVSTAIEEALSDVSEEARSSGIDVIVERASAAEVACSRGALASILGNLLRNALRYMGASVERVVRLRAELRGGLVRFEVEDTGPGLPPDAASWAFQPFVRGDNAVGHGVGLGLATVKRLVDAHGGSIGLGRGVCGGCLVCFELPVALDPHLVVALAPNSASASAVYGRG
jgi:signal transduction histidine kinase